MDNVQITWQRDGASMRPTSLEDFALALKQWRVRKGWSQRHMAKETGISRHTIMRAEAASEHLNWETLYRLFVVMQTN